MTVHSYQYVGRSRDVRRWAQKAAVMAVCGAWLLTWLSVAGFAQGESRPVETTAGWMRFRVQVEPKQTAALVVEEARPLEASFALTNLDAARMELFVREKSIDKPLEEALRKVLAQQSAIAALEERSSARDDEKDKIYDDQQRLRENMKALKGSAEEKLLLQRYTQQLNDQENRLEALKNEVAQLDKQIAEARDALASMIEGLAFDEKL